MREIATALQSSGRINVEDLSVFKVKKETRKGKEYECRHTAWMVEEGGGARNRADLLSQSMIKKQHP